MKKRTMVLVVFLSVLSSHAQTKSDGSNYLKVGSVRLWYQECAPSGGAVQDLVLLHDGLIHSVTWDDEWPELCAKYHVLRYDRRGYGRSDDASARFVPEDDLLATMRQAKMERAVLIGNSSGAGLALDFAIARPEMVDGLVLVGPVVHGMSSSRFFNQRGAHNNAPLADGKNDYKAAAENWSRDQFLIGPGHEAARRKVYEALVGSPRNLTACCAMEIRPSPPASSRLTQIQAPTLVLVGTADVPDVQSYAGAIEVSLPVALRELWPDNGHMIQLEDPEKLVKRVDRFMALVARKEATIPADKLAAYAGQYQIASGLTARVAMDGARLRLEVPGFAYQRLFAASDSDFFTRTLELNIHFEKSPQGTVSQMVIHNSDCSIVTWPRV